MTMDSMGFLHLAYGLMFVALAVRDILWVRSILLAATFSFITYALTTRNHVMTSWNVVFVVVNTLQVIRLVRERRPVGIPPEAADLYRDVFSSSMTTREFLYFWEMGHARPAGDGPIVREGERQAELVLVTADEVRVSRAGREIARLGRGHFVAEMSFLTGEPASADVTPIGATELRGWDPRRLASLRQLQPELFMKIQGVLGRELSTKVRAASGALR